MSAYCGERQSFLGGEILAGARLHESVSALESASTFWWKSGTNKRQVPINGVV